MIPNATFIHILTQTLHKIWVQSAIDLVSKGCMVLFKEESVLKYDDALKMGKRFLMTWYRASEADLGQIFMQR
jgi:hypothetical protein